VLLGITRSIPFDRRAHLGPIVPESHLRADRSGDDWQPRSSARPEGNVIVGRLVLAGTGLAFHRAKKEKEVWEAEERQTLLQQENGNVAAELQAMEDQQNAVAPAEQHHGDGE
jgi:hypothetical protein